MKTKLKAAAETVLGFALALGILAGFFWLAVQAIKQGSGLLGAALAAVATMSAALIIRYYDQKKDVAQVRRRELGSLYEQMSSVMVGQAMAPRKLEKHFEAFMRKAVVYAGPDVMTRLREFRTIASVQDDSGTPNLPMMLAFEALVLAMRRDLGVSNRGLDAGDLLRLNITDIDDYLPDANGPDISGEPA